jgi:hypothetical protein
MDAQYQGMYKAAATMQHDFRHMTAHTAHDPMANILNNQFNNLHKDLAAGKDPRTIENRLKMIDRQMHQVQSHGGSSYAMPGQSPILTTRRAGQYRSGIKAMQNSIRSHSNY